MKFNKFSQKFEIGIIAIIFIATVFSIPKYINDQILANNKSVTSNVIEPLNEEYLKINEFFAQRSKNEDDSSVKYLHLLKGNSTPEDLYSIIKINEKIIEHYTEEEIYSPILIDIFESRYLVKNNEDKALIKYIVKLIKSQKQKIDLNIIKQNYTSNTDLKTEILEKKFSKIPNIQKNPILVSPKKNNIWNKFFNYVNYHSIISIILVCILVVFSHKLKTKKWITLSEMFVIVISVSTCFTSGNHLFFTVPNLVDRIPAFDTAIFGLGPVAVIWLSIKAIFDLLISNKVDRHK